MPSPEAISPTLALVVLELLNVAMFILLARRREQCRLQKTGTTDPTESQPDLFDPSSSWMFKVYNLVFALWMVYLSMQQDWVPSFIPVPINGLLQLTLPVLVQALCLVQLLYQGAEDAGTGTDESPPRTIRTPTDMCSFIVLGYSAGLSFIGMAMVFFQDVSIRMQTAIMAVLIVLQISCWFLFPFLERIENSCKDLGEVLPTSSNSACMGRLFEIAVRGLALFSANVILLFLLDLLMFSWMWSIKLGVSVGLWLTGGNEFGGFGGVLAGPFVIHFVVYYPVGLVVQKISSWKKDKKEVIGDVEQG